MQADAANMRALTNMSSNQQVNWDKSEPGERSCAGVVSRVMASVRTSSFSQVQRKEISRLCFTEHVLNYAQP